MNAHPSKQNCKTSSLSVFHILRFGHTIISRNSKTTSNSLPTLEHIHQVVENHLPESKN